MNEQLEFLKIIATRLADARVPYMLTGSLAMAIYAEPRMTRDIDIVIEYRPSDAERIGRLFADISYVDVELIEDAARNEGMFNILHSEWIIKADFIARKSGEYRVLEFSRRREVAVEGVPIAVVSPEDLVLSKLDWTRESPFELQMRDVRAILEAVPDLNREYLQEWAHRLGVGAITEGRHEAMNTPTGDMEAQFRDLLRRLGPAGRLAMACRMFSTGRALAIAGLISRDRGLTGFSLKQALLRHVYGRDLTSDQLSAIEVALRQPDKQMHPTATASPEDHDV